MTSALAGKRVVNTRALAQAADLDAALREHGAIPLSFPCIAIRPPADPAPLAAALDALAAGSFDWLILTSTNTVESLAARLLDDHDRHRWCRGAPRGLPWSASDTPDGDRHDGGLDLIGGDPNTGAMPTPTDQVGPRTREPVEGSPTGTVAPPGPTHCHPERTEGSPPPTTNQIDEPPPLAPAMVAAVGPSTADAVSTIFGWPVAFLPPTETAADLARALPIAPGDRVLLPQSARAGPAPAAILRGRGAAVTTVVAYETVTGAGGVDLASLLAAGAVDAVCFTSGSTVRGCLDRLGGVAIPDEVRVACIGPETASVARSLGLHVDAVPTRPTARGLVEALATSFTTIDG